MISGHADGMDLTWLAEIVTRFPIATAVVVTLAVLCLVHLSDRTGSAAGRAAGRTRGTGPGLRMEGDPGIGLRFGIGVEPGGSRGCHGGGGGDAGGDSGGDGGGD